MLVFPADFPVEEVHGEEDETVQRGADYYLPEAGGAGDAGSGSGPADRDFGADLLPLEEAVCGHGIRPGPGTEAGGRGECAAQEAGGGAEPGQGSVAERAVKKIPRPALMKEVVAYVVTHHGYSQRRACGVVRQRRSTQRLVGRRDPRTTERQRMREIAAARVRYGYRRIHVLLRREGWALGKNLVYRLYGEEGLTLRRGRPKRRKMVLHREARCIPVRVHEAWSLDFVHDQLSNGQKFRALAVIDIYSREALAIEVGQRLRGEDVVAVLNRLVYRHGAPRYLFADNGGEFTGRLVDLWAYHPGVRMDFLDPDHRRQAFQSAYQLAMKSDQSSQAAHHPCVQL